MNLLPESLRLVWAKIPYDIKHSEWQRKSCYQSNMYQQLYRSYNTQIVYKYIYRILRAKQIYNVYEGVILKSCTSPTPFALLNKGYFLCGFWYSDLFLTCLLQKQHQSPSKTRKIFTQSLEWLTWAGAFWRSVHRELCVSPRCVRCVGRWPPVSDQSQQVPAGNSRGQG